MIRSLARAALLGAVLFLMTACLPEGLSTGRTGGINSAINPDSAQRSPEDKAGQPENPGDVSSDNKAAPPPTGRPVTITALRYGKSLFNSQFIFNNDPYRGEYRPFHWLFYLIELGEKKILVDSGFDSPAMTKAFGVDRLDPAQVLEETGVSPREITDLIITHSHFDHIGGIDLFPRATLYIHPHARRAARTAGLEPDILERLNEAEDSTPTAPGRLVLLEDTTDLFDGALQTVMIGGHAPGSLIIKMTLIPGTGSSAQEVILTGDELYLAENFTRREAIGTVVNLEKNQTFIRGLQEDQILLPFHDPQVVTGEIPVKKVIEGRLAP